MGVHYYEPRFFILTIILLFALLVPDVAAHMHDGNEQCIARFDEAGISEVARGYPKCEIPGNGDLYGLGVRLGIYLTWVSSWIANNFVAGEMGGSLDTNSIFLFALALCFIILSAMEKIYLIDHLILVQLSLGYILGVMTLWGNRTRFYQRRDAEGAPHFGGWGTHCRLILCMAAATYSLWFWTVEVMDPDPGCFLREECNDLKLGLFGARGVKGSIRYGNAAFSAGVLVYYGAMTLLAIVTFTRHVYRRATGKLEAPFEWIPQELEEGDEKELTLYHVVIATFNILWIIFTVFCVEFTLVQNSVENVLATKEFASAGQLLPLMIGLFSMARLGWIIYKEHRGTPPGEEHQNIRALGKALRDREQLKDLFSFQLRKKKPGHLFYDLLDNWMPWLNCFPSWQRLDQRPGSSLGSASIASDVEKTTVTVVSKS